MKAQSIRRSTWGDFSRVRAARWRWSVLALVLLTALAATAGCAPQGARPAKAAAAPQTKPGLSPERPVIRTAEFVAVLTQPGDTMESLAAKYLGDPNKSWWIAEFNGFENITPGMEVIIPLKPFERGGLSPVDVRAVPILTYHNLSKTEQNVMTVTEANFDAQMAYLKKNGYRAITLDQFNDFVQLQAPLPEKAVMITFDDGWRSTWEIGMPILKKYDLPAVIFIYTDFVGQTDKALTWEMVTDLEKNGFDVQCHSKSHRDLTKMNDNEQFEQYFNALVAEMTVPSNMVQEKLRHRCAYLAYPYGATNRLVSSLAEKHGYRLAFTVNRGSAPFYQDRYRIDRSMIYGTHNMDKFVENLTQDRPEALQ